MKTIKLGNNIYDLACDVVRNSAAIRVTILKGMHTLADIAPAVSNVETIEVFDGETLVATYTGFTHLFALNIFDNYPADNGASASVISIELMNVNVQSQIDALNGQIDAMIEVQNTQEAEIADIGEAVDDLAESQGTQDLAIEDLAEAVNDLTPEEE